jgi:nucleotide-binding universal stress UspA family protein
MSLNEFKKILVPVDGSDLSNTAFHKALALSDIAGGVVDVIHVSEYPSPKPLDLGKPKDLDTEEKGSRILKPYNILSEELKTKMSTILEHGDPAERIVERSTYYDIIVMGTKGRNPVASILLGSVAEEVARKACCPVMLISERINSCKV